MMYLKYMVLIVNLILLNISNSFAGDKYHVMYVKGIITLAETDEIIKIGDSINQVDKLKFSSGEAFADVLSLEKGRVVLRPPQLKSTNTNESEAFYLVKSIVAPKKASMNTRSGLVNNIVELRKLFSKAPYLLLDGKSTISINPASFPMNNETFFFVSYNYMGKAVNKKLSFNNDKLTLSYSEIFSLDGKLVNKGQSGDFDLIYYDSKKQEQTKVAVVNYLVPDYKKIKNEVKVMSKVLGKSSDKSRLNNSASSFLVDRYGYASEDDVARLINEI